MNDTPSPALPAGLRILPDAVPADLAACAPGKLTLRETDAPPPAAFTLLDTFDGALARKGLLLLETGGRLDLVGPDGTLDAQPGEAAGRRPPEIAPGPVRDALAGCPPLRALLPVGTGQCSTIAMALVDDEDKTRARLALRHLVPDGKGRPVLMIRTDVLRGYDRSGARLDAALDALVRAGSPAPAPRTLTDLLFPERGRYRKKPALALAPDTPAGAAVGAVIRAHLDVARRNLPGIIADHDTEFLHDYRVALRKVRSALSLFGPVYDPAAAAALSGRFSELMAPSGPLRDLDVRLLGQDRWFAMLPPVLHDGLGLMIARFRAERQRAQKRLATRLQSPAHAAESGALTALFAGPGPAAGPEAATPFAELVAGLARKREKKLRRIARAITPDTPEDDVHRLRLQVKKLRYLLAFARPLCPRGALKPLTAPLARLQDTLGAFNDYAVQQQALIGFLDGLDPARDGEAVEIARSAGALIAELARRQDAARAEAMLAFAEYDAPGRRDGIRAAIRSIGDPT